MSSTEPKKIKKPIWKNLGPRAISALVFAGICIPPLYFGGFIWAFLTGILGLRLVYEWVRMSDPAGDWRALAIPMAGLIAAISYIAMGQILFAIAAILATSVLAACERYRRGGAKWSGLGALYILTPTVLMVLIRGNDAGFSSGFQALLFIILIVVAADTGAYFGGSMFKGAKMAPKLSPNKTWSGFFSGLLFGIFVGVCASKYLDVSPQFAVMLAAPVVVFSVVGDFLESGLKRKLNVKDTGTLMPGHGGLLDRLDGLMLAVVASALVLWLVPSLWPGVL